MPRQCLIPNDRNLHRRDIVWAQVKHAASPSEPRLVWLRRQPSHAPLGIEVQSDVSIGRRASPYRAEDIEYTCSRSDFAEHKRHRVIESAADLQMLGSLRTAGLSMNQPQIGLDNPQRSGSSAFSATTNVANEF